MMHSFVATEDLEHIHVLCTKKEMAAAQKEESSLFYHWARLPIQQSLAQTQIHWKRSRCKFLNDSPAHLQVLVSAYSDDALIRSLFCMCTGIITVEISL